MIHWGGWCDNLQQSTLGFDDSHLSHVILPLPLPKLYLIQSWHRAQNPQSHNLHQVKMSMRLFGYRDSDTCELKRQVIRPIPQVPMYTGEREKYSRHWCSKKERAKCTIVTGPWQFGNPSRCMLASFYTPGVGRVPWLGPSSTLLKYMPSLLFFWALGNILSTLPSWLFFPLSKKWPILVREKLSHAWGWCTGMTQRDGMGREEGGGLRMGNTCIPVVDSFWYLAKLIQLCKV